MAANPRFLSILYKSGPANHTIAVNPHAINKTNSHPNILFGSELTNNINVAKADGPAMSGIANGTIKGSPSNVFPITPWRDGNTIRIPIINRMIPPAMLTDSLCNCSKFNNFCPKNRKSNSIPNAINNSLTIIFHLRFCSISCNNDSSIGTLPSESSTKNSTTADEIICSVIIIS